MKKSLIIVIFTVFLALILSFFIRGKQGGNLSLNFDEEGGTLQEEGGGGEQKFKILGSISEFDKTDNVLPIRNLKELSPDLEETAGIAVLFTKDRNGSILYQKNIDKRLPIASLTKLMTAMIVIDKYPLEKEIIVSQEDVWTEGESGRLSPGEKTSIKNLLYLSLLVSSNDAASTLARVIGEKKFVELMNEKVKEIGLLNTHFANSHGLDDKENFSTAKDLAILTQYSLVNYPSLWEILKIEEIDLFSQDHLGRQILHHVRNTNKLLSEPYVLGGKTGYTQEAKDTMILVSKAPGKVEGNIVLVILGVDNRIQRTKTLYDWILKAWRWE